MLAAADSLAIDLSSAQALKARAAAGDKGSLRAAAQQFESLMIGMMLKSMRETKFSEEDDPMTSGEGVKLYRDLLDQQWAEKLAKGRGLGFADMMVKSLERYTPAAAPGQAAATAESGNAPALPAPVAAKIPDSAAPRPDASSGAVAERKRAFLETLRPHAESAAASTGVPADYILAHAALESGWGQREITAADGGASHNLFGIKAGGNWKGEVARTLTTEYRQGVPMKLMQSFRAYPDYGSAFADYAGLLKARYGAALASNDATGFADELAAAGYATDPAYAGKLKSVIASVATAGV